ncbi:hypothetical protein PVAP13_3KG290700 [Panicum virgatum]|uniref:Uncharacterized protein n=1 Tax=Panicum virgatum TaxID=38727 RepID=A0A8T0UUG7_PANVG|nr:hypothetical protein PVAP13_3KG290700 [Panicum virgatum]
MPEPPPPQHRVSKHGLPSHPPGAIKRRREKNSTCKMAQHTYRGDEEPSRRETFLSRAVRLPYAIRRDATTDNAIGGDARAKRISARGAAGPDARRRRERGNRRRRARGRGTTRGEAGGRATKWRRRGRVAWRSPCL